MWIYWRIPAFFPLCDVTHRDSSTTSISLLDAARGNDQVAWQQLCDVYTPLAYSWIRKARLQDSDAADLIQNVFRIVAANLNKFHRDRPGDTFRGWLWTITRNELRTWYRARASRPDQAKGGTDVQMRLAEIPDWIVTDTTLQEIDPDDTAEQILVRRAAKLIERDFQPNTWQAFWRATVEGESAVEIAKDLGMTAGAVRQAKLRVLVRLREMLA
jgi:RNA polymerase sigma-70 factor (ECF subfamily)